MTKLEHVGIVVGDLEAAKAFFAELGLELEGEASLDGPTVDRITGLEGVRTDIAMMWAPDGDGRLELIKYHTPPSPAGDPRAPSNAPGLRHILFSVEGIDEVLDRLRPHGAELVGELAQYENSYRICYVRGPEGIIVELAEAIG
ncbi:VOC family protein [Amycolatopsis sp. 195334CR]|uniref:VOC family protein n=1 Tax=Amycolatopsis sp. 195334CR TaxID=2814588 RepID=UPI001A8E7E80|nr:VOC family protein [Amycolatopsis sp. 195334CR]MBN6041074.1 VOC family protein [Amycolatopsis sp. 195334CR]